MDNTVPGEINEREELQQMLANLSPDSFSFFMEAQLGREAKEFYASDIGRYLVGCAQQEYAAASAKLKTTHFWRWRRIVQLQNEMWRAEQFMVWLRDLIIRGKAAENALEEREE